MAVPIAAALTLSTKAFTKGLSGATKGVGLLGGSMVKLSGIAVRAGLALTALGAVLTTVIVRQTALTARLVDTASKLGVGVEFLQKFRYAAEQTGVGIDTADMALQRFTRRVAEASQGTGEARGALMEMGIALRSADGRLRSTQEVLFDVADSFQQNASESDKLRLAFKLFDSEGAALVNTLNDGSKGLQKFFDTAQGLGFVLTQESAEGVKRFDDALTDLRAVMGGVISQITGSLAPALEVITKDLVKFISDFAAEKGGFKELGEFLGVQLVDAIKNITKALIGMAQLIINMFNKVHRTMASMGLVDDVVSIREAIAELKEESQQNIFEKLLSGKGLFKPLIGKFAELREEFGNIEYFNEEDYAKAIAILERKLAQMESENTGFLLPSPEQIDSWFSNFKAKIAETSQGQSELAKALSGETETIAKNLGYTLPRLLDDIFGRERMDSFWQVFDSESSTAMEKLRAGVEVIFGKDGIGRLKEKLEPLTDVGAILEDGALKAFNALNDSLVDFIKTGKLSFSSLGEHIKNTLIQAFVSKAIMGPLLGILGLGSGGGAGIFGSLFGRANGGPTNPNKPYIVGEQGPELFVPRSSGMVLPNHDTMAMMGGGGGGTTQVTYNIQAVDARSFKQLVAQDPEFIYGVSQAGARRLPR